LVRRARSWWNGPQLGGVLTARRLQAVEAPSGRARDLGLGLRRQRRDRVEELLHDTRDLGVRVRVVGGPQDLVGAEVLRGEGERDLVGIEADHALTGEELARERPLILAAEHLELVVE